MENKRLGAVLSVIQASQVERDKKRLASKKVTLREKERIVAAQLMTRPSKPSPELPVADGLSEVTSFPPAIRGGAESAGESAQRSSRPPPQGAGPGTAPSLIRRAQPDISTWPEGGHLYLGLTAK